MLPWQSVKASPSEAVNGIARGALKEGSESSPASDVCVLVKPSLHAISPKRRLRPGRQPQRRPNADYLAKTEMWRLLHP
jgi:hypothetical protein